MGRYNTTTAILDENGKRRGATTIIDMPVTAGDIYIKTTSYERLDMLAHQFYGDVSEWYRIAIANKLGKGTLWVPTDTILRIPRIENIDNYIVTLNTNR